MKKQKNSLIYFTVPGLFLLLILFLFSLTAYGQGNQKWKVFETTFVSTKDYSNPFMDVQVDVLFEKDGKNWKIPAFWDGDNTWKVRFAPPETGTYSYRVVSNDKSNKSLNGKKQFLSVAAYNGNNKLFIHGMIGISEDGRHFAHADGTPFFWLGDTWWKNLCKRLTWQGFQELAADRKEKGFSVIQIVCGPYPDEGPFEPRWENEGGMPYKTRDFTVLNPDYFNYADRRLEHLVDAEMVPAIVGAWGRADCDAMKAVGVEGLKRHWRYLIARYGAFPVVWILGGELPDDVKWGTGTWGEIARYVREIDPYQHPISVHSGSGRRGNQGDDVVISYDMVGGNHDQNLAIHASLPIFQTAYEKDPPMPVLVGETCYEGHMQQGFEYIQRHIFWMYMLSGAAGHTYGAAGIWHASVEGDPGCARVYDWTTWRQGMNYPGATQLGKGKRLLEQYDWSKFEPHPGWTDRGSFAAGIVNRTRFIYLPRREIYYWSGITVHGLEQNVPYNVFFFDPSSGRKFDRGKVINVGSFDKYWSKQEKEAIFQDEGGKADATNWSVAEAEIASMEENAESIKGRISFLQKVFAGLDGDYLITVDAKSKAGAGIVVDDNILAIYSPSAQQIYFYGRQWGVLLGAAYAVDAPDLEENIKLTMLVRDGKYIFNVTDGKHSYSTAMTKWMESGPGMPGLWHSNEAQKQDYSNFNIFKLPEILKDGETEFVFDRFPYHTGMLPSPQDWVLVLERDDDLKPCK